jgi:hypothetical protein
VLEERTPTPTGAPSAYRPSGLVRPALADAIRCHWSGDHESLRDVVCRYVVRRRAEGATAERVLIELKFATIDASDDALLPKEYDRARKTVRHVVQLCVEEYYRESSANGAGLARAD